MDQWDPMKEAFEDKRFNSYNEGVGRDLSGNNRHKGVRLYVQNVPESLGQNGFYNLFAEHGTVLYCRLIISDRDQSRAYGFITMQNMLDAEKAIYKLNGFRLGQCTLKVTPAWPEEERNRRRRFRQDEEKFQNDAFDRSNLQDRQQLRVTEPATLAQSLSGSNLNKDDRPQSQMVGIGRGSNNQMTERADGINYSQRNVFPNNGVGRGALLASPVNSAYQQVRAPYVNKTVQDNYQGTSQATKNDREKRVKVCTFCGKEGCVNLCSQCRMYYCSVDCQKKDWPRHRDICMSIGASTNIQIDSKSGPGESNLNTNRTDSQRSQVEKTSANQAGHFENVSKLQSNNSIPKKSILGSPETTTFKNQLKTPLPARTTQFAQEKNKFWNNKEVSEEINLVQKETVFEGTSGKKEAIPLNSVQEKQISNKIPRVEDSKNNIEKKFQTKNSEETTMINPDYQNKLKESVSKQNWDIKAEAAEDTNDMAVALEAKTASPSVLELSLDVKTSGSCYLTHFASPHKFWISLEDFLEVFTENTLLMEREISKIPPSNPVMCKVGETYGLLYMGEWCRVTILSIKDSEATVFMRDYGNKEVVKLEDLRPLTKEMLQLPAQAICCSVSRLKPKERKYWSEEACKSVKDWLGEPMSKFLQYKVLAKGGSAHAVDISIDNVSMSEVLISGDFAEQVYNEPGLPELNEMDRCVGEEPPRYMAQDLPNKMDEIKKEDKLSVVLKDFTSMQKFAVLHISSFELLNELNLLLQSEYSNSTASYRPIQGELVAVKFIGDGNWCRAEVINIDGDNCTLFFVDYGNNEVQTVKSIRRVTNQKLIDVPKQALICSLFAAETLSDCGLDVMSIVNQEFLALLAASITSEGHGLLVVKEKTKDTLLVDFLTSSGLFLSETLTQRLLELSSDMQYNGSAELISDGQNISKNERLASLSSQAENYMINYTLSDLGTETLTKISGNTVRVLVSFVKSPAEFYVRLNSKHELFISMMKELNSSVLSSPVLSAPSVGSLAAIQFSQDNIWYRGIIERIEVQKCLVCFIDYGNREETMLSSLRVLPPSVHSLPAQAIKCCLDGKLENLTRTFVAEFKQNLEDNSVDIKICGRNNEYFTVQVFKDGTDICQCSEDMQISSEKPIKNPTSNLNMEILPDTGEPILVMVTHVDSFSRLFISRKDKLLQSELCQIMIKLNKSAHSLPYLENPVEGSVCAAQYSQDSNWYRARVVEVCKNANCIVQFVDYGNKEKTLMSKLRKLEPAMTILPGQAICCCLFGYESDPSPALPQRSSDTAELIEKLRTEVLNKSFNVKVVDRLLDIWIVKMENENGDCLSRKFPPPSPQTSTPKLSDLIFEAPAENEFEAFFFDISNFNDFYCQRYDEQVVKELQALSDQLRDDVSKCDGDFNHEPVVNGVYASNFEGNWYRCIVEEVKMPNVLVRYIDYGNSETIPASQLRPLNPDRLVVPIRLLKCRLYGVTPVKENWNSPEIRGYMAVLQKHIVHLVINGKEKDTFLVSLSIKQDSEKISVAADLVNSGMAKFTQVVSPRKEERQHMLPSLENSLCQSHDKQEESEEDDTDELELQKKILELELQLKLAQKKKQHKH